MSTRAGIIIKDKWSEIHFYRHSDGYPEGVMPSLEKFLSWVKEGKIRDNAMQSAGWLVMIGADEYGYETLYVCDECEKEKKSLHEKTCPHCKKETGFKRERVRKENLLEPGDDGFMGWKVGAYEPTDNVREHGDLEHIYVIDLEKKKIKHESLH